MDWFDTHCHVEDRQIPGGADTALRTARANGVVGFVNVGVNLGRSKQSIKVAASHDDVWATVGIHPHPSEREQQHLEELRELAREPRVVGIGECGLDYNRNLSPQNIQQDVFAAQIALAHEVDLPLIIHTRDAWPDTFAILDEHGWPATTILHCFTGTPAEAERCLAAGAYLSFSGLVTYGPGWLRDAARIVPGARLLTETDAPYLTPEPLRSAKVRKNQPANVALVGEFLAELRGDDPAALSAVTVDNAKRVFRLP